MKPWFPFLALLAYGLVPAVSAEGAALAQPPPRLVFDHIDPQDAAIPPFTLVIGPESQSTGSTILGTETAYRDVCALVQQARHDPLQRPRPSAPGLSGECPQARKRFLRHP